MSIWHLKICRYVLISFHAVFDWLNFTYLILGQLLSAREQSAENGIMLTPTFFSFIFARKINIVKHFWYRIDKFLAKFWNLKNVVSV